jgi:protein O-mannosyl-transferase
VVCVVLGAATMAVFWPALRCGFIQYDDQDYVTANPDVQHGLNWRSVEWAFSTTHAANWHPLTWLSHIVDCQLYGLRPAGHHLTSLLLHTASSVLLLLLLCRLTGAFWPSVFVAAMFALHPLRVESVVWVAERKDVLSTFFWMLTVWAYARCVERGERRNPSNGTPLSGSLPGLRGEREESLVDAESVHAAVWKKSPKFKLFYALALVFFALGLMAKPMLVTLPFVLLLLDYWPLGRFAFGAPFPWRLIVEKAPFLLLALGDSVATFDIQHHNGAVGTLRSYPLSLRLENVPVAYVRYLGKNFWPVNMAIYYPSRSWSAVEIAGAICVLAVITILAAWRWRAQPYLAVGWLWFLGALVPAIGLVQVGTQAMADRYTYIPCIGLWIMAAWSARDWIDGHPERRSVAAAAGAVAVLVCMALTFSEVPDWRDSRAIFTKAAETTGGSYVAYYNIGCYAAAEGKYGEAIESYNQALQAEPDNASWADHAPGYNDLGYAYLKEGELSNAVASLEKALELRPRYGEAYYNLGCAFLINKQPAEAADCLQRALAIDSGVAAIHYKLANALMQMGKYLQAIAEFRQTLKLSPEMEDAVNNLAWLLATCPDRSLRNGAEAVTLARQASEHSHNQSPIILGTLAAAYAEAGNLSEAVATAQRARQLALEQNNKTLAGVLEGQLLQYQKGAGGSRVLDK